MGKTIGFTVKPKKPAPKPDKDKAQSAGGADK